MIGRISMQSHLDELIAAVGVLAGHDMDPDPRLPENIRMVLASFETTASLPFARQLWSEDAADTLPSVQVPTLVVIGGKDLQVDARIDGGLLQGVAGQMRNVTFVFPANANHVLKEEPRSIAEIAGVATSIPFRRSRVLRRRVDEPGWPPVSQAVPGLALGSLGTAAVHPPVLEAVDWISLKSGPAERPAVLPSARRGGCRSEP